MKKVILFSAMALSVAMLAGCSGKEHNYDVVTNKNNSANSGIIIVEPPESDKEYDQRVQTTDSWKFVYDKQLGGIKIIDCLCVEKNGGGRVYNPVDDIVVPRTFDGFEGVEVLEIGEHALGYIKECNSITLPDSIKYIDAGIFIGSNVKQPIVIPPSVEDYSEGAFGYMKCDIQLPSNLKTISKKLFYGSDITHITIPSSVEVIEEQAFYQCQYLTDIDFGDGLKRIDDSAFENCWGLESVTFNDGLEEIGTKAFFSCHKLGSVTFGSSLKKIKGFAFSECSNQLLKQTIYLPDSLSYIGLAFPRVFFVDEQPRMLMYKGELYSNDELIELLNPKAAE